jgi:hypothetical protein
MHKVTAESLKDFQVCTRYYDYKFNDNLEVKKNIRQKRVARFGETIRSIATFFFYKKQAFSEPSYQALEHRWQKLWFKEDTTIVDIATARNEILWESDISYTTQAAAALISFHEDFYNRLDLEVVMIDESFTVPVTNEVAVEGVFDVVLREKKSNNTYKYHIYKWVTSDLKKPVSFWLFDFAILNHAFRYRNNNKKLDVNFYIWDFGSTIPKAKQVEIEDDDMDSMYYWCKQVTKENEFVPKRGLTPYCKSCAFDEPCSNWSFKEVKLGGS